MVLNRKSYRWFYDHVHSRYYNLLIKWCFLPFGGEMTCRKALLEPVAFSPGDRILDLCCGTGGATCTISKKAGHAHQIVGLDLSGGQIRAARKRPQLIKAEFVKGDAAYTPFRNSFFDKVFITHALHEMPREIRRKVLAEARRILKDGGLLIALEVNNPESLPLRVFAGFWFFYWLPFNFETPTRRDMWLRGGLVAEIEEAGFKHVTKITKFGGIFQTVSGVK
jgi:ubiquinone/menaquinone biosynthesis C-methylase UbiE